MGTADVEAVWRISSARIVAALTRFITVGSLSADVRSKSSAAATAVDHLVVKPLDVRLHDTIQPVGRWHRCPALAQQITVGDHRPDTVAGRSH